MQVHPLDHLRVAGRPLLTALAADLVDCGWQVDDDVTDRVSADLMGQFKNGKPKRLHSIRLYWEPIGMQVMHLDDGAPPEPIWSKLPWRLSSSLGPSGAYIDLPAACVEALRLAKSAKPA